LTETQHPRNRARMSATTRTDSKKSSAIVVRVGRTAVRIYPRAADRGRSAGFMLADYSTGKRRLRWFVRLKDAKAEAVRIATLTNAGDLEGASMTGEGRQQLVRATSLVAPYNLDVPTACALFSDAAKLVGPHKVVTAAEQYAKLHPAAKERIPIAKCVAEYQAAKEAKKRSERHLGTLRSILGRFERDHPGKFASDFTTAGIQSCLDKLKRLDGKPVSALTRKSHGSVVGSLFEYLRRRGMAVENPCRDLERESDDSEGDVERESAVENLGWVAEELADDALKKLGGIEKAVESIHGDMWAAEGGPRNEPGRAGIPRARAPTACCNDCPNRLHWVSHCAEGVPGSVRSGEADEGATMTSIPPSLAPLPDRPVVTSASLPHWQTRCTIA